MYTAFMNEIIACWNDMDFKFERGRKDTVSK